MADGSPASPNHNRGLGTGYLLLYPLPRSSNYPLERGRATGRLRQPSFGSTAHSGYPHWVPVAIYFLPLIDPRRERYQNFSRVYLIIRDLILAVLLVIFAISGLVNLGYHIQMAIFAPVLIGLLFIVLGNYMGKIKPNWFVGIRTPWTLSSESVWNKTHRLGGWTFVLAGLVLIISPLFPTLSTRIIVVVAVVVAALISTIYSYFLYSREQKQIQR